MSRLLSTDWYRYQEFTDIGRDATDEASLNELKELAVKMIESSEGPTDVWLSALIEQKLKPK